MNTAARSSYELLKQNPPQGQETQSSMVNLLDINEEAPSSRIVYYSSCFIDRGKRLLDCLNRNKGKLLIGVGGVTLIATAIYEVVHNSNASEMYNNQIAEYQQIICSLKEEIGKLLQTKEEATSLETALEKLISNLSPEVVKGMQECPSR